MALSHVHFSSKHGLCFVCIPSCHHNSIPYRHRRASRQCWGRLHHYLTCNLAAVTEQLDLRMCHRTIAFADDAYAYDPSPGSGHGIDDRDGTYQFALGQYGCLKQNSSRRLNDRNITHNQSLSLTTSAGKLRPHQISGAESGHATSPQSTLAPCSPIADQRQSGPIVAIVLCIGMASAWNE
jgi:hypothetical protein